MNKSMPIIVGVVLVVLVVGGYLLFKGSSKTDQTVTPAAIEASPITESVSSPAEVTTANIKEFTVTGSNYKFDPANLTVSKGDKVRITFKSSNGTHNLVFDDFNVRTRVIQSGETETVEFTADKSGSFEYYCSVANHRAMGMKGTLVVN